MYTLVKILTNTMTLLIVLLSIVTAACGQVISPGDDVNEVCEGSTLVFYGENYNRLTEAQRSIKKIEEEINLSEVESIVVEGCGCFFIYSGTRYRGRSEYIAPGKVISRDQVRFNAVKSIKAVECTQHASPYYVVIGAVVGVVILVAVLLIIGTKMYRRRQFQGVSTSETA